MHGIKGMIYVGWMENGEFVPEVWIDEMDGEGWYCDSEGNVTERCHLGSDWKTDMEQDGVPYPITRDSLD